MDKPRGSNILGMICFLSKMSNGKREIIVKFPDETITPDVLYQKLLEQIDGEFNAGWKAAVKHYGIKEE